MSDALVRFWFRFVYGRPARYNVDGADARTDLVEPELPDFVNGTFEGLCYQAVLHDYGDQYRFVEEPSNWWDGSGRESPGTSMGRPRTRGQTAIHAG